MTDTFYGFAVCHFYSVLDASTIYLPVCPRLNLFYVVALWIDAGGKRDGTYREVTIHSLMNKALWTDRLC